MADTDHGSATPRFEPGARVRAKYGVTVPDFEDIPLGGWTGTIKVSEKSEDEIVHQIEWDKRTLDAMHPVYLRRCERDGLRWEIMWLTEKEIEPDDETTVPIEQPTEIKTPPLSPMDQDDRVRMAFGLTHDDPIPEIGHDTLLTYHRYLAASLKFPFAAVYGEEQVGPYSRRLVSMTVTGLLAPEGSSFFEEVGLICTGRDRGEAIVFPLVLLRRSIWTVGAGSAQLAG